MHCCDGCGYGYGAFAWDYTVVCSVGGVVAKLLEHGCSVLLYTVSRDLKVVTMHDLSTLRNRALAANPPWLP